MPRNSQRKTRTMSGFCCCLTGLAVLCISAGAVEEMTPNDLKGAYSVNGELQVNTFGDPEGEPITRGHKDMKPSWSKTGGKIVFFRLTRPAPRVSDWKTAICVVNADGTGFRKLTDGTQTDFNPTWTRDGTNLIVFNRRDPKTGRYAVMLTRSDASPGDEYAVSGPQYSTYAYSCLKDGRMFVSSWAHPAKGRYFLMRPSREGSASYEPINFTSPLEGTIDRVSISPSETRICYEFQKGFGPYRYPGRTLYVAGFDVATRTVSDPVAITDTEPAPTITVLYPRWTKDESAVVYHCNRTGRSQLYMYRLRDAATIRVSTNPDAGYAFPCGEETPK